MSAFFAALFGKLLEVFLSIFKSDKPLENKVLDAPTNLPKKPDADLLCELGISPIVRPDTWTDDGA